ncbi:hypothetical protein A3Q34_01080 [Colwellia sp. PAMC 20917]|jgi:hypothetical protein|uniref:HNH endonuclease n=1 Tax=Colwellia sp. PAMC 20917 TaxID=1816218 RepID=UPI000879F635|nr:HNH endonuclease [Colwellia sp. PAMC 20917]AOW75595.1 hypothetical protein A3Q34_01080 [Colwellia sp. PAMC 20917]
MFDDVEGTFNESFNDDVINLRFKCSKRKGESTNGELSKLLSILKVSEDSYLWDVKFAIWNVLGIEKKPIKITNERASILNRSFNNAADIPILRSKEGGVLLSKLGLSFSSTKKELELKLIDFITNTLATQDRENLPQGNKPANKQSTEVIQDSRDQEIIMSWIDYVVQAMENLGGESDYSDLYDEVEKLKKGDLTPSWKATVRNTVESYSSDSDNWSPTRADLFFSVNGKGRGRWALRDYKSKINPIAIDHEAPDKQDYTVSRFIRDSKLARTVKEKNDYKCQICDFTFLLPNGKPYAETHHLKPLGGEHVGPDIEGNMICLCPNHHAMLDYCTFSLNIERIISSSAHNIAVEFLEYSNQLVANNS